MEIPRIFDIDDLVAELEAEEGMPVRFQEARRWAAESLFGSEGDTLQALRLRRGLSQAQLAAVLGMKQPILAHIEAGKGDMTLDICLRLADALDIDLNTLRAAVCWRRRSEGAP